MDRYIYVLKLLSGSKLMVLKDWLMLIVAMVLAVCLTNNCPARKSPHILIKSSCLGEGYFKDSNHSTICRVVFKILHKICKLFPGALKRLNWITSRTINLCILKLGVHAVLNNHVMILVFHLELTWCCELLNIKVSNI